MDEHYGKKSEMQSTNALIEIIRAMNHDIRNHLLHIQLGLVDIQSELLDDMQSSEAKRRFLANISMIEKDIQNTTILMNFYAPKSFEISVQHIDEILSNVIMLFKEKESDSQNIRIKVNAFKDKNPGIKCSVAEISTIIYNLLSNSRKAIIDKWLKLGRTSIAPEGLISVILDYDTTHHYHILIVEDDGIGIKNEHLSMIYELGFTTQQSGLGIGLNFIKETLENNYNGAISCDSNIDKGTKFELKLKDYVK